MRGLWNYVKVREDLFDKDLDAKMAPSLNEVVLGTGHKIYTDPDEFIKRTYITKPLRGLIRDIVEALARGRGVTLLIPSAFGGGKTHAMILIYHLFKRPDLLKSVGIISGLEDPSKLFRDVSLIVVDGTHKELAPSPLDPLVAGDQVIRTLWGYVAYKLGRYEAARKYDEMLITPDVDGVSQIIRDSKVLMLFDELAYYYNRLSEAPRPEEEKLRKYAKQVIMFLRTFSEYTERSRVVLVISVPAEPKGEELIPEPGYEDFVNAIREVARAAVRREKPVATAEDYAMILKTRIFDDVKSEGANVAYEKYSRLHRDYRDEIDDIADKIVSTYPFHPYFIEALKDILENNKNLQKTRDALRIARVVVRKLLESERESLLIMPADINLRDGEIRSLVLTESYRSFDYVVDKMVRTTMNIPAPHDVDQDAYRELALKLVSYVLLKTYTHTPGLEPKSAFPTKREIVTAVHEPLAYEKHGLTPKAAAELLEKLASGTVEYRVPHLYTSGERYWVTTLLDLKELVEKEADKVGEDEVLSEIKRHIKDLYARPFGASRDYKLKVHVLSKVPYIVNRPQLIDLDGKEYILVTVVEPVTDVAEGYAYSGDIYDLVFYRSSGGFRSARKYRNTIVVLFSNDQDKWKKVKELAKRLIACRRIKVDELTTDGVTAKFLKGQLGELGDKIEKSLLASILEYFNHVAFPDHDGKSNVVRVVKLSGTGKTLLEVVETTLKNNDKVIVGAEDFNVLPCILMSSDKLECPSVEWDRELKVKDIEELFFEDPKKHMVPEGFVKSLINVGIENLKIGVLRRSGGVEKVFFKKAEDLENLGEPSGEDVVIPWFKAAEMQLSHIGRIHEAPQGECVERKYYVAVYEGEIYPLYDLKNLRPKDYLYVFKNSELKLVTEKVCDTFEIEHEKEIPIFTGAETQDYAEIEVIVKKVGKFNKKVVLKVSDGFIEPSEGIPDFKARWRIPVPKSEGSYTYSIEGASEGVTLKKSTLRLAVFEKYRCLSDKIPDVNTLCGILKLADPVSIENLINILTSIRRAIEGAKVIEKCSINVSFPSRADARILIEASKVDIENLIALAKSLSQALAREARIESEFLTISMESGKVINPNELREIKGKVNLCCRW